MPSTLQEFDIQYNQFFGDINTLTLSSIHLLYMNNNQFNGTVSWQNMSNSLQEFDISHNQLSGNVYWEILATLQGLTDFWLNDNHFIGDVDLSHARAVLNTIYGYNNDFDGTINMDGITSNLQQVFFQNNSGIVGGINFNLIDGNRSVPNLPRIYLDEHIYCDYCINLAENDYILNTNCWIPQNRNNTQNGYCGGIRECNNTCTPCLFNSNTTNNNCTDTNYTRMTHVQTDTTTLTTPLQQE